MKKRSIVPGVVLASCLGLSAALLAQEPETAGQLQALRTEMARLDQAWREAEGEERQLYYDILHQRGRELDDALDRVLSSGDPAALPDDLRDAVVAALDDHGKRLDEWTALQSAGIQGLRDQLPEAEPDRQLEIEHLLTATNDRLDDLLAARVTNLERLQALGETPDGSDLDARLRRRAELDSARVQRTRRLLEVARDQAARSSGDARADVETQIAALREKLAGSTHTLETVSGLLERRGFNVSDYREQLLETTGLLTVESLDREVVTTALQRFWSRFSKWVSENWAAWSFKLVLFAAVLALAWAVSRLTTRLLARLFHSQASRSRLLAGFVSRTAAKLVLLAGLMLALSQVGIELGPLLAGLGVAGLVLGLALQDTLSNLFSGLMILLHGPYDVDDVVEAGGVTGTVHAMSLVTTTILTFDNKKLIVPNKKIWADTIQNVTAQRVRRVDLEVGVSYGDDVEQVETVLREIVKDHPLVLEDPPANVRLHRLDDSAVTYIVRPWVKSADYWTVYWDLLRTVKLRFDAEGISIPFPQRDLHIVADGESAPRVPGHAPDAPPPARDPAGEDAPGEIDT